MLIARRLRAVQPSVNCGTDCIEMAGEEMVSALDDDKALRLREVFENGLNIRARAKLVRATLDDQLGLGAGPQVIEIDVVGRQAEADQFRHPCVLAADPQANP